MLEFFASLDVWEWIVYSLATFLPISGGGYYVWQRNLNRKQQASLPKAVPKKQKQQPEMPMNYTTSSVPSWVTKIDRDLGGTLRNLDNSETTPTVIIGLGDVGRAVLPQISLALRNAYDGVVPDNLRLLQIDVCDKAHARTVKRPDDLALREWLLLDPDFGSLQESVEAAPDRWQYLSWYAATGPDYARSQGRMALFHDLMNGAANSKVWQRLYTIFKELDSPRLCVVGSTFDDVSSGMLIDVARLVQIIKTEDVDVELWLTGPVGETWSQRINNRNQTLAVFDQESRTLATLRELERFQQNNITPFQFVSSRNDQDQLHDVANFAVVQTLFLFEKKPTTATVADHLSVISDSLLATLSSEVKEALSNHFLNSRSRASALTNENGIGTAVAIGAYTLRVPTIQIREAIKARLIYETLFDKHIGLVPLVALQDDGTYEDLYPEDFRIDAVELKESIETFLTKNAAHINSEKLLLAAHQQVGSLLNGDGMHQVSTHHVVSRVGGLLLAQRWVKLLQKSIAKTTDKKILRQIRNLNQLLADWVEFFELDLKPYVKQQLLEPAQSMLRDLNAHQGRTWILSSALDWGIYHEQIRNWTGQLPVTIQNSEPLIRAGERIGWWWEYAPATREWSLELGVAPNAFKMAKDNVQKSDFIVKRSLEDIAVTLDNVAEALALSWAPKLVDKNGFSETEIEHWMSASTPLELASTIDANAKMGTINRTTIVAAPKTNTATELWQMLSETGIPNLQHCKTVDKTNITLLQVRSHTPIQDHVLYSAEKREEELIPAELFVRRGEQLASSLEAGFQKLSGRFISWLERDAELIQLIALAETLGLYEQYESHAVLPGIGRISSQSLDHTLTNIFSSNSKDVPQSMNSERNWTKAKAELRTQVQHAEQTFSDEEAGLSTHYSKRIEKLTNQDAENNASVYGSELELYTAGMLTHRLNTLLDIGVAS